MINSVKTLAIQGTRFTSLQFNRGEIISKFKCREGECRIVRFPASKYFLLPNCTNEYEYK